MTTGSPASGVAKGAAREGAATPKGLIRKISCALYFLHRRHYCELRRPRRYLTVNVLAVKRICQICEKAGVLGLGVCSQDQDWQIRSPIVTGNA